MYASEPEPTTDPQGTTDAGAATRRRGDGQLWPFGVSGRARYRSHDASFTEQRDMQVALLGHEGGDLREGSDAAGVRRPVEHALELARAPIANDERPDELFELRTECLLMRDGLLDACNEISRAMLDMQRRLENLPSTIDAQPAGLSSPDAPDGL
jgi:hypothetical protein